MPWSETTPMLERRRFIDEFLRGGWTISDLCASYGISRRVGYKWLTRFLVEGDHALADHSRRPRTSPWAIAEDTATLLLTARRRHPTWGPRKILAYLRPRHRGRPARSEHRRGALQAPRPGAAETPAPAARASRAAHVADHRAE